MEYQFKRRDENKSVGRVEVTEARKGTIRKKLRRLNTIVETDLDLVKGLVRGEMRCYDELYNRWYKIGIGLALKFTKDFDMAEEATQEAFIKVFTKINKFKQESKFSTWLYRIIVNEALQSHRKLKKYKTTYSYDDPFNLSLKESVMSQQDEITPERNLISKGKLLYLTERMRLMDKKRLEIWNLIEIQGATIPEASKIINITIGATKSRIHRAREEMQPAEKLVGNG